MVQPGDTFGGIAQKEGIPVARLEQLNPKLDTQLLPAEGLRGPGARGVQGARQRGLRPGRRSGRRRRARSRAGRARRSSSRWPAARADAGAPAPPQIPARAWILRRRRRRARLAASSPDQLAADGQHDEADDRLPRPARAAAPTAPGRAALPPDPGRVAARPRAPGSGSRSATSSTGCCCRAATTPRRPSPTASRARPPRSWSEMNRAAARLGLQRDELREPDRARRSPATTRARATSRRWRSTCGATPLQADRRHAADDAAHRQPARGRSSTSNDLVGERAVGQRRQDRLHAGGRQRPGRLRHPQGRHPALGGDGGAERSPPATTTRLALLRYGFSLYRRETPVQPGETLARDPGARTRTRAGAGGGRAGCTSTAEARPAAVRVRVEAPARRLGAGRRGEPHRAGAVVTVDGEPARPRRRCSRRAALRRRRAPSLVGAGGRRAPGPAGRRLGAPPEALRRDRDRHCACAGAPRRRPTKAQPGRAGATVILTVTLNAAIDRTVAVPNFRLGHRHRAVESRTVRGRQGRQRRARPEAARPPRDRHRAGRRRRPARASSSGSPRSRSSTTSPGSRGSPGPTSRSSIPPPASRPRSTSAAPRCAPRRSTGSSRSSSTSRRGPACACSPEASRPASTPRSTRA